MDTFQKHSSLGSGEDNYIKKKKGMKMVTLIKNDSGESHSRVLTVSLIYFSYIISFMYAQERYMIKSVSK